MTQENKEALRGSILDRLQEEIKSLDIDLEKCFKNQNYSEARVIQSKIDGINKSIAITGLVIGEFCGK